MHRPDRAKWIEGRIRDASDQLVLNYEAQIRQLHQKQKYEERRGPKPGTANHGPTESEGRD
jgi:hypothetical protein